jgi:hypothetical protein
MGPSIAEPPEFDAETRGHEAGPLITVAGAEIRLDGSRHRIAP